MWRDRNARDRPARVCSPRSLKTAQKPQRPPFDKRAVENGYHPVRLAYSLRALRKGRTGRGGRSDQITVKIVRAHGGCLGTKSR
jgi:hypothetical protein